MSDLVPWLALLPFIAVPALLRLHGKLDDRIGHERWLAYQADRQHRYVLAGNDFGIYGHLRTVENMKIITDWKADQ